MKKETTWIPKDANIFQFLNQFFSEHPKAWLYLHSSIIWKLNHTDCRLNEFCNDYYEFEKDSITLGIEKSHFIWSSLREIRTTSTKTFSTSDPDEIFFIKLEA